MRSGIAAVLLGLLIARLTGDEGNGWLVGIAVFCLMTRLSAINESLDRIVKHSEEVAAGGRADARADAGPPWVR